MRICLVTAFPPGTQRLNEYGWHLAEQVRQQQVTLTILADQFHDYRMSRFRPVVDGPSTFWELFQIFWRDLRGSYPRAVAAPAPLPAANVEPQVLVAGSSTGEAA